mmetsp:Transcript_4554/g.10212  ORF Transcript_4554/g.10212 Transcript_4554/m.10212 type:complete len:535 (+) Transcript_4554:498-2102(+)
MRPFKPAPKNASANRIRERYLHQLGLQRGAGAPLSSPAPDEGHRVVVISGLPSLPEDRATTTTEHVMESHDFSISRNSQGTAGDDLSGNGAGCCVEPVVHVRTVPAHQTPGGGGEAATPATARYNRARLNSADSSVLSVDSGLGSEANEALTSMALPPPGMVLHHAPAKAAPGGPAYHFRSSGSALSKPAFILLSDGDSVSSQGTNTTAGESSFTRASSLAGRDWSSSAPPHQQHHHHAGSSPQEVRGVHLSQYGRAVPPVPGLLGGPSPRPPPATASSLASALGRFNIDSDRDDVSHGTRDDDDMSAASDGASWTSAASLGSAAHGGGSRRRKGGRAARLMDRAKSHERILRIRSEGSARMRAGVVGMQRMGPPPPHPSAPSTSPGSPGSCGGGSHQSLPLVHVCHGPQSDDGGRDLGRTPTSSNCTDLRPVYRHPALGLPPGVYQGLVVPPCGASVAGSDWSVGSAASGGSLGRPMSARPRLARDVPPGPLPGDGPRRGGAFDDAEILEVARTLSMLGGRHVSSPGIAPRIR